MLLKIISDKEKSKKREKRKKDEKKRAKLQ